MNTLVENPVKLTGDYIQNGLDHGIGYGEYRLLVGNLAKQNSNSGPEKTEAYANYTQLNNRRMKRWDKTLKISEEIQQKIKGLTTKVTWLVLTESWCGDAAPSLPVMNKLAELSPKLDLKIILRDEHPELMDLFLTNGVQSIPKLIVLDRDTNEVIGEWGPRSTKATQQVEDYKKAHGALTPEFKQDLQVWYNKDKGADILNDLVQLLALE